MAVPVIIALLAKTVAAVRERMNLGVANARIAAVVGVNHNRTSVRVYTDEYVAGFGEESLTPGPPQGGICCGF
jgi:hypothetical protein